ncbi:OsmC family protein [Croceicoccus sp. Ery5]|uniref:OsmC family protein n=1 Tax=Croceicoccus sp. Ery5 TaxID=1703340 RepID=UPI001E5885E0|nr:OsmC family protein [Croceicoccus sp. Ery5]
MTPPHPDRPARETSASGIPTFRRGDDDGGRRNGFDLAGLGRIVEGVQSDPAMAELRFRVATRWTGQTRSESMVESCELGGQRISRRFKIASDEPTDLLGGDSAPNPQELLISALNACMAVSYVALASRQGIALSLLEIDTSGSLDLRGYLRLDRAIPPGYRQLDFTVRIGGDGTPDQFRAIHEDVMRSSPNFSILSQPICMNGRLEIV